MKIHTASAIAADFTMKRMIPASVICDVLAVWPRTAEAPQ
jgi:hypothetical protein